MQVVRAAGRRLRITATTRDPRELGSAAEILVLRDGRTLKFFDRYPSSGGRIARDCIPPDGEYGGFWLYNARLTVTIVAPHDLRVEVRMLSGTVTGT